MNEELVFQEDIYDLDGLLRVSEHVMADFIFMIREEDTDNYYMDRDEIQKYDTNFSKFVMRVKDYLAKDEERAVFVLFATAEGDATQIFDGKHAKAKVIETGDVELSEGVFYGMIIQNMDGEYLFTQGTYTRESYKGDAYAEVVQDAGELTELMEKFILEFN